LKYLCKKATAMRASSSTHKALHDALFRCI
jgi:hypothetical protein